MAADDRLVIDDFSNRTESALGTQWGGFTDRVMGGRSNMSAGYEPTDGGQVLRMTGSVSLENNGGFIQVRLPLANGKSFDASSFTGIAVEARGTPGSYYLHLRTRGSWLPWQYYDARINVDSDWTRVEIPFTAFEAQSTSFRLNTSHLQSLAVVGGKEAFSADISVRLLEFYR